MSVYRSFLDELIKIAASWGLEKAQIATRGLNPTLMGVTRANDVYGGLEASTRKLIESHPMVTQHGMTPQAAMQVAGWSTKPGQSLGDFFAQQHLSAMKQPSTPTPSSGFGAATNPGRRPAAAYASATNPGGRPAPMQSGVMPTVRPPAPAVKAAPAAMKTVGPPMKAMGGGLGALPKPAALPSIGNAAKAAVKPAGGLGKIVGGFLQKAV